MVDNPQIPKIQSILKSKFITVSPSIIQEKDLDEQGNPFVMKRDLVGDSMMDYIAVRIDPNKVNIFPYFEQVHGLNKICDFIIFAETNTQLMVLLIEMKRHSGSPEAQINTTEPFINFIFARAKRIGINIEKEIIIRKLGLKDSKSTQKQLTKYYKNFHFNSDYYSLEQGGTTIRLRMLFDAPVYDD